VIYLVFHYIYAEFVLLSYKIVILCVTCVVLHIRLVFKNSKYLPIVSTWSMYMFPVDIE